MRKVKNIYYIDANKDSDRKLFETATGVHYGTGLILELSDGTFIAPLSTDMIEPFAVIKPTKSLKQLILEVST